MGLFISFYLRNITEILSPLFYFFNKAIERWEWWSSVAVLLVTRVWCVCEIIHHHHLPCHGICVSHPDE